MLLNDLLSTGIYENAKVIAGIDGLMREVQTVNIMDSPDIIRFLRPNELLLTNGYFMKQQPELLIQLIRDMQRLNCCGMAIKTRRFELILPDEIVRLAESSRFPLIEISDVPLSLGEILQQSTSLILNNKNDELQYALSIHKKFSEMIMKGKGITDIINSLSKLLFSPVILVNSKLQAIAVPDNLKDNTGLIAAAERALQELSESASPTSICLADPRLRKYSHLLIYPVRTYRHEGYLLSFHSSERTTALYELTLEQATNVIGMEITKSQAVKERSRRYKTEFFSDLIEGYINAEQEALNRGKKYGLYPDSTRSVVALRNDEALTAAVDGERSNFRSPAVLREDNFSEQEEQYDRIKRFFNLFGHPFVMFTRQDTFCILLHIPETGWDEAGLIRQLNEMTESLYNQYGLSLSAGIGKPTTNMLGIKHSYTEAVNALNFGYRMKRRRFVQSYRAKDISYLFHMLPHAELRQFYEETLSGLIDVAEQERTELLRTLSAFTTPNASSSKRQSNCSSIAIRWYTDWKNAKNCSA